MLYTHEKLGILTSNPSSLEPLYATPEGNSEHFLVQTPGWGMHQVGHLLGEGGQHGRVLLHLALEQSPDLIRGRHPLHHELLDLGGHARGGAAARRSSARRWTTPR